jgi:hypothetical protein
LRTFFNKFKISIKLYAFDTHIEFLQPKNCGAYLSSFDAKQAQTAQKSKMKTTVVNVS